MKWQQARVLPESHRGALLWVRVGRPDVISGTDVRSAARRFRDVSVFSTHLVKADGSRVLMLQAQLELLPEFAEHVDPEYWVTWFADNAK